VTQIFPKKTRNWNEWDGFPTETYFKSVGKSSGQDTLDVFPKMAHRPKKDGELVNVQEKPSISWKELGEITTSKMVKLL
jgi:hypothetical protein